MSWTAGKTGGGVVATSPRAWLTIEVPPVAVWSPKPLRFDEQPARAKAPNTPAELMHAIAMGADMIGTSRETVTRHLRRLKRRGVVSQRGRTLVIKMASLKALAPDWPASQL